MSELSPVLKQRFFNSNGVPLAGGLLYSYAAGTTTPLATYTDETGLTPNTNPVVLDANGQADVWMASSNYKFMLTDPLGIVQWTVDNVEGVNGKVSAAVTAALAEIILPIVNGGTGQTTAAAAMTALSPITTTGDMIYSPSGATNARLPIGTDGKTLMAADTVPTYLSTNSGFTNAGFKTTVGSNALTITLTQADGSSAPSSTAPCFFNVRNSTATTGGITTLKATSGLTLVVPSTATLGSSNGVASYYYLYICNSSGSPVLGIIGQKNIEEGSILSSTAISSSANSKSVLYTGSALSNVGCVLIGRLKISETTAGTWATNATECSVYPFEDKSARSRVRLSAGGYGSAAGTVVRIFSTIISNVGSDITYAQDPVNGDTFTINTPGVYSMSYKDGSSGIFGLSLNNSNTTTAINSLTNSSVLMLTEVDTTNYPVVTYSDFFDIGDVIRAQTSGAPSASSDGDLKFSICKVSN